MRCQITVEPKQKDASSVHYTKIDLQLRLIKESMRLRYGQEKRATNHPSRRQLAPTRGS